MPKKSTDKADQVVSDLLGSPPGWLLGVWRVTTLPHKNTNCYRAGKYSKRLHKTESVGGLITVPTGAMRLDDDTANVSSSWEFLKIENEQIKTAQKILMDKKLGKTTNLCNLFTMESRLESFEMWAYRRMLRVSWTEHKTNEEVLKTAKTRRSLLPTIKKRKYQYFGHVIRMRSIHKL